MTLPGGAADKLGNRYETWWTLSELVRMLRDETEAIRIEDPGFAKAEFVVTAGSRREFHQAKRSHRSGRWSLVTFRSEGLLEVIGRQLAGNDDRFVFVSGSEAPELVELCDAARDSESVEEFQSHFLAAQRREQSLQRLTGTWACGVPTARERLRRIEVRTIGEHELAEKVRLGAQVLFLANPHRVTDTLRGIVGDGAFDLVERLVHEARGAEPATIHVVVVCREFDWRNDSRLRRLLPDSHAQVDVTQFTNDEVKTILDDAVAKR